MVSTNNDILDNIEFISSRLIGEGVKFVFAGSVSTMIQGCELTPGDIDILVANREDVQWAVSIFCEFLSDEIYHEETEMDEWMASKTEWLKEFSDPWNNSWTFSRLLVNGVKLEIANICTNSDQEYIEGAGMWENGPHVWRHIRTIPYKELLIPVIPLEIQLETNMNRNKEDRVKRILEIFRSHGYEEQLVNYSLSKENRKKFREFL